MKVKLDIAIISQENPKIGYTIIYNYKLCHITGILNEDVTVRDCFTNEEYELDLDYVKDNHVLFLIRNPKSTVLLIHRDVARLTFIMKEHCDKLNLEYATFIYYIVSNQLDYFINGEYTTIYSKPVIGDKVEIINLNVVDNYTLYKKEDRIFTIESSYLSKHNKDIYILSSSKRKIKAARLQFKLISNTDSKDLFTLK